MTYPYLLDFFLPGNNLEKQRNENLRGESLTLNNVMEKEVEKVVKASVDFQCLKCMVCACVCRHNLGSWKTLEMPKV